MLAIPGRVPKVVTVRVQRAQGLSYTSKQKKVSSKWKVQFVGGKKKMSSNAVLAPNGDPVWDYEVTLKLDKKSDSFVLLVTDSDDHHVGQAVLQFHKMQQRPPHTGPADPAYLQEAELEPTKKIEQAHGEIFYWIWVEEFRVAEDSLDNKSGKSSHLSSKFKRHGKTGGSVIDSINYSGSTMSLASNDVDGEYGKKSLRQRVGSQFHRRSKNDQPDMSLSRSMTSVYLPSRFKDEINGSMPDDQDGSILGVGSDITRSESTDKLSNGSKKASGREPSAIYVNKVNPLTASPRHPYPIHEEKIDDGQRSGSNIKPEILRLSPTSCATSGGVDLVIFCSGVTNEILQSASLLIDGLAISRKDWYHENPSATEKDSSTSLLRVRMPERPSGKYWIELETLNYGRIRCPQAFVYLPIESTWNDAPLPASLDGKPSRSSSSSASSSPKVNTYRDSMSPPNSNSGILKPALPQVPSKLVDASKRYNPVASDEDDSNFHPQPKSDNVRPNGYDSEKGKSKFELNCIRENEQLQINLSECNKEIRLLQERVTDLQQQLTTRTSDVDRLSYDLCRLRNRLLEDGVTKYLENERSIMNQLPSSRYSRSLGGFNFPW